MGVLARDGAMVLVLAWCEMIAMMELCISADPLPLSKGSPMGVQTTLSSTGNESTGQLGADIRLLGNLLGEIIREQHGNVAFDLVEQVRAQARSRRQHVTD